MTVQQVSFQDRIARIQAGQVFTKTTIYVGQETAFSYVPGHRQRSRRVGQTLSNARYALEAPAAVLVGFLCHGLERMAEFAVSGLPDPTANPDVAMAQIAITGFLITIVVSHLLGLRDRSLLGPKLLGVVAGMLFFHNLVHWWPRFFDTVFSPIWVAQIVTTTEANSLYWRGISFPF